jgi:hypothetical protein
MWHARFSGENLKDRANLKESAADEKTLMKWILKDMGREAVDWIYLAQDRDK